MLGSIKLTKEKLIQLYVDWMVEWYDDFLKKNNKKLNCNMIFNEFITSVVWMCNDKLDKYKIDGLDFENFKKWEFDIKDAFIKKWKERKINNES